MVPWRIWWRAFGEYAWSDWNMGAVSESEPVLLEYWHAFESQHPGTYSRIILPESEKPTGMQIPAWWEPGEDWW